MNHGKNSLLYRIRAGFLILSAAAIVWASAGVITAVSVRGALTHLNRSSALLRNHMEADMLHDTIRGDVMALLSASANPAVDLRAQLQMLADHGRDFRARIATTREFTQAPEIVIAAGAVGPDIDRYLASADAIAAQMRAGQPVPASQIVRFGQTFERLEDGMAGISDRVQANVAQIESRAQAAGLIALIVTLVCLALIAGAMAGLWRRVKAEIMQPMLALSASLDRIAHGDLDLEIAHAGKANEIGDLARSIDGLRGQLCAAETARGSDERVMVQSLGVALSQLATGNLAVAVREDLAGAFGRLKDDFNAAVGELGRILRMVRDATGETMNTASEISQSVDDLSSRNEQQAASIQAIAHSITGVTERVAEAARAVGAAQHEVREVNAGVSQGGEVIASAVAAMDRIETSSAQIGSIVTVIDGIAFQTNLLALNAGVEAARAGEAGKGFAVVATEVRALAQRSADAASEIKQLINASGGEVETGVRLVREAGEALQAIMGRMDRIAQVMDEVSTGAQDQSTALQEIDPSTRSLEQITQSNAALAEEVSAATRQVFHATRDVSGQLASFRFGEGDDRQARSALAA